MNELSEQNALEIYLYIYWFPFFQQPSWEVVGRHYLTT